MDIFFQMACLSEQSESLKGAQIREKWFRKAQNRDIGNYLPKFLIYNSESLKFLGVEGRIEDSDERISVHFRSSNYIGVVPLVAADTGLQIGDFVVNPRFVESDNFSTITDIIQRVKTDLSIEHKVGLSLASGRVLEPPFFLEAIKFVKAIRQLIKSNWVKFRHEVLILDSPSGNVNWDNYIRNEYKVEDRLKFLCTKNNLSKIHVEYAQIKYVYNLCRKELMSLSTPLKARLNVIHDIEIIDKKLEIIQPITTNSIGIRASDSLTVKNCKQIANRILKDKFDKSLGWRVDFSELFERYIQYLFSLVSQKFGGVIHNNIKFHEINRVNVAWRLKFLVPDLVYDLGEEIVVIDAKYKSNLYNVDVSEGVLKDEHRHDLHQILAYSSFSQKPIKTSFLCYPSSIPLKFELIYLNPLNNNRNKVFLLGIPINLEYTGTVVDQILDVLKSYNREEAYFPV